MSADKSQLSPGARKLINQFQGGFPIVKRPFLQVAAMLGMRESALITLVQDLVSNGVLSRFGPMYNASRMGGSQTLAALEVPQSRFSEVSDLINDMDQVAHNYRREHRLNMWFVLATEKAPQINSAIETIQRITGLNVFEFPKLQEFYIGLFLHIGNDGSVDTKRPPDANALSNYEAHEIDRELMLASQAGLPIQPEPYSALAENLNVEPALVRSRFRSMISSGVIRRIGAIPNHYRLGLRANGMTVWDVDDSCAQNAGAAVGRLPFVSHCYLRPRYSGIWPYNLFAMVHGENREQVHQKVQGIRNVLGERYNSHDVLFSSAVLKKTGLRLAA
ncbi:MAG: siroheme decarboxylase subunit beta [bacterium]